MSIDPFREIRVDEIMDALPLAGYVYEPRSWLKEYPRVEGKRNIITPAPGVRTTVTVDIHAFALQAIFNGMQTAEGQAELKAILAKMLPEDPGISENFKLTQVEGVGEKVCFELVADNIAFASREPEKAYRANPIRMQRNEIDAERKRVLAQEKALAPNVSIEEVTVTHKAMQNEEFTIKGVIPPGSSFIPVVGPAHISFASASTQARPLFTEEFAQKVAATFNVPQQMLGTLDNKPPQGELVNAIWVPNPASVLPANNMNKLPTSPWTPPFSTVPDEEDATTQPLERPKAPVLSILDGQLTAACSGDDGFIVYRTAMDTLHLFTAREGAPDLKLYTATGNSYDEAMQELREYIRAEDSKAFDLEIMTGVKAKHIDDLAAPIWYSIEY